MNDTTPRMAAFITGRFGAMSPAERVSIALQMNATARRIVLASLPTGLPVAEVRRLLCQRLYGDVVRLVYPRE